MVKRAVLLGLIVMGSVVAVQAQMPPGEHPVLKACKGDIAHFCGQVPPGEGRVKNCMKAHLVELSEPCKEALFQAWLRD